MIRKTILAIAAVAAISTAALVPTDALAKGKGGHHGHHDFFRSAIIVSTTSDDCEWKLARNRHGYLVKVWVCD